MSRRITRRHVLGATAAVSIGASACSHSEDTDGPFRSVARLPDLEAAIARGDVLELVEHHVVLSAWDPDDRALAALYGNEGALLRDGTPVVALSLRCPHMGCRIPFCSGSGWFECPCHGAWFTGGGRIVKSPSDRGMSWFPMRIIDEDIQIDLFAERPGSLARLPDAPAAGPFCIGPPI